MATHRDARFPEEIPENSIVPIVRAVAGQPVKQLLGTGFFVGVQGSLRIVTAKHVLESNPLASGEAYAIAFREERGIRFRSIDDYIGSFKHDIALIDGSGFPLAIPLPLAVGIAPLNVDVITYEYSTTRIEHLLDGTTKISIEPLMHKGNVMRHYVSDFPESIPTPSFLTSFPALQGASGAPVMMSHNSAVIGLLTANYERHLLPAQIVKITHDDHTSEETSYFLPLGKAISISLVAAMLDELKAPYEKRRWEEGLLGTAGLAPEMP